MMKRSCSLLVATSIDFMKNRHFNCEFCDTMTETGFVEIEVKRQGKDFTSKMKAEICPNCKEEYFDGGKLVEFESNVKKQLAGQKKQAA